MPAYATAQAGSHEPPNQGLNLTALVPGDKFTFFDAESPTAGSTSAAASVAAAFASAGPVAKPSVFTASWAAQTGAFTLDIMAANDNVFADYVVVGSITTSPGYYADDGAFAYYLARLTSNGGAGTGLTCKVQR